MPEPTMPTIAELLGRIQKAAQRQMVACPNCFPFAVGKIPPIPHCKDCGGTGRISNPAFRDFLVLVQRECNPDSFEHQRNTCECYGTGFVLRTAHFENANIGETEGGLLHALSTWEHLTATEDEQVVVLRQTIERWLCTTSDHRVPALTAVADWLAGLPKEVADEPE